jgi:hypothetical protein
LQAGRGKGGTNTKLHTVWSVPIVTDAVLSQRLPKVVRLAVDLLEHLIQVPLPIRIYAHLADPFLVDLSGKQRAKSVPPVPHNFVADVDAALVRKVLDVSEQKWKANVQHDCQANDFWVCFEVPEWGTFCHLLKLSVHPARPRRFPLIVPTDILPRNFYF